MHLVARPDMPAGTATAATAMAPAAPARVASIVSQYLIFTLGGEAYAVGTMRVREIIEYGGITAVPMVPTYIRGVINLRGAVVPVVDLNARFGRPLAEVTRRTCIVILDVAAGDDLLVMGIVVDMVSAVRQIDSADIEPPPRFGTGIRTDFIEGMAKVRGQFVMLLDLAAVLSVDEISMLGGMARQAVALHGT